MTAAQALVRIEAIQRKALVASAQVALAQVMPFVPIDTGALRESGKIIDNAQDNEVFLEFGGKGSQGKNPGAVSPSKYASNQYSTARRHFLRSGKLGRLLQLFTGAAKTRAKGKSNKSRYAAAYRQAIKNDSLTVFPNGVRWFKIILRSAEIRRKMASTYARAARGN